MILLCLFFIADLQATVNFLVLSVTSSHWLGVVYAIGR